MFFSHKNPLRKTKAPVDCCVVDVVDRAVRSNSPARLQIVTSILPPPAQKFVKNPLLKTMPPRNPPAVPAPDPAYAR